MLGEGARARGHLEGILELPADAPVGTDLRDYLQLDDDILELNVTPNRGDAMSVLGIAREVAALDADGRSRFARSDRGRRRAQDTLPGEALGARGAARSSSSRVVRGIDNRAPSPAWLRERLRRAGLRAISPVVDVTNYVMLELGQPMHAYDLGKLKGGLEARLANAGEPHHAARRQGDQARRPTSLVIADAEGPVGMAGVMGGARTLLHRGRPSMCCSKPRSSRPPPLPVAAADTAW